MKFLYAVFPETLDVLQCKSPKRLRAILMPSGGSVWRVRRKYPHPYKRPHRSVRVRDEELN